MITLGENSEDAMDGVWIGLVAYLQSVVKIFWGVRELLRSLRRYKREAHPKSAVLFFDAPANDGSATHGLSPMPKIHLPAQ
jgi:hypothetical protein